MRLASWMCLCFVLTLLGVSCQEGGNRPMTPSQTELKESLEKANRYLINEEEEDINNYIARHHYHPIATGTGLRYQVLHEGKGNAVVEGQTVVLEYELKNIMGDVIYSSEDKGLMAFVVGHGDVVSGLDEAVRHLHQGDVAVVIIPSHLGYGLLGDRERIPEYATLIYTIRIKEVKQKNNESSIN